MTLSIVIGLAHCNRSNIKQANEAIHSLGEFCVCEGFCCGKVSFRVFSPYIWMPIGHPVVSHGEKPPGHLGSPNPCGEPYLYMWSEYVERRRSR